MPPHRSKVPKDAHDLRKSDIEDAMIARAESKIMNLNKLAERCHQANKKWWQNIETGERISRNPEELLMLVITELSEAVEGERKNLADDKLPHRKMAEVEMADAKIRILDFAAGLHINLFEAVVAPLCENKAAAIYRITRGICEIGEESKIPDVSQILSIAIARIDWYCAFHGYDLDGAFEEKMAYNATREDHKHEARRIAGGKQF